MVDQSISSPYVLVISNRYLAEYLIELSAKNIMARLPKPIASPEPTHKMRNLAFTNPSTAKYGTELRYFVRGWGNIGKCIERKDSLGDWKIERAEGISRIFKAKAKQDDPFTLENIVEKPVIKAQYNHSIIDKEDPRVSFLEDWNLYAITVTETRMARNVKQDPSLQFNPVIYITQNFERYTRKRGNPTTGLWLFTKDWVLFPKKVSDPFEQKAFAALFSTRVGKEDINEVTKNYYRKRPGIWIAYSHNLVHWYCHKEILLPRINEAKLGPSSQPIELGKYWLIFIHAVKMEQHIGNGIRYIDQGKIDLLSEKEKQGTERVYTPQAILLDKSHPEKVYFVTEDIAQPKEWEISPEYRLRHHMITSAMKAILLDGQPTGRYITWYGGGDKHSGAAIIHPENLRQAMQQVPKERIPTPKP